MQKEHEIPSRWTRINSLSNDPMVEIESMASGSSNIPSRWTVVERFPESPEQKEPEPESRGGLLLRGAARSASRAAETAVGLPKSIMNLAEGAYGLIPESLREFSRDNSSYGLPGTQFAENLGPKIWEGISNLLPSSQQTREAIGSGAEALGAPKEYLEPKNLEERAGDEIVSDLVTFMLPGGGPKGIAKKLGSSALKVVPANMASYLTKRFTGSEKAGDAVKTGAYLLSSLAGRKSVDLIKEKDNAYDLVEKAIRPGERVNSTGLLKAAEKVQKDFTRLGYEKLPSKKKLDDFIESLKGKAVEAVKPKRAAPVPEPSRIISLGVPKLEKPRVISKPKEPKQTIDLKEFWEFKKDTADVFDVLEKDTRAAAHLSEFRKDINHMLKNQVSNPKFSAALTEADHINTAVEEIRKVNKYIDSALGGKHKDYVFARSFLHHPIQAMKYAALARGAGKIFYGGSEAKIILDLMNNSPSMKAAYSGMLRAAAQEKGPILLKQAAKFYDSTMHAIDKAK